MFEFVCVDMQSPSLIESNDTECKRKKRKKNEKLIQVKTLNFRNSATDRMIETFHHYPLNQHKLLQEMCELYEEVGAIRMRADANSVKCRNDISVNIHIEHIAVYLCNVPNRFDE